jgi:hypothetical protein
MKQLEIIWIRFESHFLNLLPKYKVRFALWLTTLSNIRQLLIFHGEFSRFVKSKKIVGLSENVDKSIFHI